jgi:hypothetical protein
MVLMLPRIASPQGLMASGSETHGDHLPTVINFRPAFHPESVDR